MYSITDVGLKYSVSDAMCLMFHCIISSCSIRLFASLRIVPRTRTTGAAWVSEASGERDSL